MSGSVTPLPGSSTASLHACLGILGHTDTLPQPSGLGITRTELMAGSYAGIKERWQEEYNVCVCLCLSMKALASYIS